MGEYIARSYIRKMAMLEMAYTMETETDAAVVLRMIDDAPAADVAPVVHGRWEMRPTGMATDTGPEYKAYCTVCNEPNKQYQPPFCPHCGAKMNGERKDGGDG